MTARDWLINGGGGYEGGADGLRASTWTSEGLVSMLEAYEEDLAEFGIPLPDLLGAPYLDSDGWHVDSTCEVISNPPNSSKNEPQTDIDETVS